MSCRCPEPRVGLMETPPPWHATILLDSIVILCHLTQTQLNNWILDYCKSAAGCLFCLYFAHLFRAFFWSGKYVRNHKNTCSFLNNGLISKINFILKCPKYRCTKMSVAPSIMVSFSKFNLDLNLVIELHIIICAFKFLANILRLRN